MKKIVVNVLTGDRSIIDLTPDEEADVVARELLLPVPKQDTLDDLKAVLVAKGVLTQADFKI